MDATNQGPGSMAHIGGNLEQSRIRLKQAYGDDEGVFFCQLLSNWSLADKKKKISEG